MTVKSITSAILAEAKDEAQKRIAEVTEEANKLESKQRELLAAKLEEKRAQIDKEAKKVYSTEMVKAGFIVRNEELLMMRSFVDKAFDKALERLHGQKKEERKKVLLSLLKKANAEMDVSTIYVNAQDKSLVPSKYAIKTMDNKGGLISESKSGDIKIDLSYEAILEDIKEQKVEEITSAGKL